MDILYVTKTSILSDGGGGEERARRVTGGLTSRGHAVTVLCGATDSGLPKWTRDGGRKIRHVNCVPSALFRFPSLSFYATRYLFALFSLPVLAWLLITRDVDVIVENMTPYPSLTLIGAKVTGTPIVAVQHEFYDLSCYRTYDPVTATIQILVQNLLRFGNYEAVIVPTIHVAHELKEYGVSSDAISVIPNGVDADRYNMAGIDRDPCSLITIGRLSKRKGQATVLRAFERIQCEVTDAHLDVLGKGPAQDDLEALAVELGISNSVTFHGYVDFDRKVELMNETGLFVFASRQEGFGLVILEAMAAGLPVVARRLPVYEDFFEDGANGTLVEEPVVERLATEAFALLENDSERKTISSWNRQTAREFSWLRTIDETESVIVDVVETNRDNSRVTVTDYDD